MGHHPRAAFWPGAALSGGLALAGIAWGAMQLTAGERLTGVALLIGALCVTVVAQLAARDLRRTITAVTTDRDSVCIVTATRTRVVPREAVLSLNVTVTDHGELRSVTVRTAAGEQSLYVPNGSFYRRHPQEPYPMRELAEALGRDWAARELTRADRAVTSAFLFHRPPTG